MKIQSLFMAVTVLLFFFWTAPGHYKLLYGKRCVVILQSTFISVFHEKNNSMGLEQPLLCKFFGELFIYLFIFQKYDISNNAE